MFLTTLRNGLLKTTNTNTNKPTKNNTMAGLSTYYRRKAKHNLKKRFSDATDDQFQRGLSWYADFNELMKLISIEFCKDVETVTAVFCALSPRNKLGRNVYDTLQVLHADEAGEGSESVKVCTFDNNKEKAFDILSGDDNISSSALKTYSFLQNVAHLSPEYVTVDSWHLKACLGPYYQGSLTALRYRQLVEITIDTAEELNVEPYQLQAIVWNEIREAGMTEEEINSETRALYKSLEQGTLTPFIKAYE